jgi:type VI secretion system protein ImpG
MERRLIQLYEGQLKYIREAAREFGQANPKLAGMLDLDRHGLSEDPYVERLLEGFAFLTAGIERRFESEFPAFTQGLLESLYPEYLTPFPSCGVVQFPVGGAGGEDPGAAPDPKGFPVEKGFTLTTQPVGDSRTLCTFRTASEIQLLPIRITDAAYVGRELGRYRFQEGGKVPKAGVSLRLKALGAPMGTIHLDRLRVFVPGGGTDVGETVFEAILSHHTLGVEVFVWEKGQPRSLGRLGREAISWVGVDDEDALLPVATTGFSGFRLLREYFGCPERFQFFEISGLRDLLEGITGFEVEVMILLGQAEERLERRVSVTDFHLHAVPVVNLFEVEDPDPIILSHKAPEYRIIPEHGREHDYELYQVISVEGRGQTAEARREFLPFFFSPQTQGPPEGYFTVRRENAQPGPMGRDRTGGYLGSIAYLSVVDLTTRPRSPDLKTLRVRALYTNRHLPSLLPRGEQGVQLCSENVVPAGDPLFVSGPTDPIPAPSAGSLAWRAISHLSVNFMSLVGVDALGEWRDARGIRELLRLYADMDPGNGFVERQVASVRRVSAEPIVSRLDDHGRVGYARGLAIKLEIDPEPFGRLGVWVFGAILGVLFSRLISINSFVEMSVWCPAPKAREIMRWPLLKGSRWPL